MDKIYSIFTIFVIQSTIFFRDTLLNHSRLEHSYSSKVFVIVKRAIQGANGVSMAMMMLSHIKLF